VQSYSFLKALITRHK